MSGTKGYIIKQRQMVEAERQRKIDLRQNQEQVKLLLMDIVKQEAGWTIIEPEFKAVINASLAGNKIDISQLQQIIASWVANKETPQ